ncbi:hypothetical protein [Aquibacillus sediminis]|nr:hypothetical protein [Aquibacillus sediminis]
MNKKTFQPKDTGKLTNVHYGTKKDDRQETAMTEEGTKNMKQFKK